MLTWTATVTVPNDGVRVAIYDSLGLVREDSVYLYHHADDGTAVGTYTDRFTVDGAHKSVEFWVKILNPNSVTSNHAFYKDICGT